VVGEGATTFAMNVAAPCTSARRSVVAGEIYSVRLTVLENPVQRPDQPEAWSDSGAAASPELGDGADLAWWTDLLGIPFRRVMPAGWLQPLVQVQAPGRAGSRRERLLGRPVQIERLGLVCDPKSGGFVAQFTPTLTGTLRLFVNDAMLPGALGRFYANSRGLADVQVWKGGEAPPVIPQSRKPLYCAPVVR
jgi:hypothetical protein